MSTPFNSYWLEPGAVVPVDIATTAALVTEIQRLRQALNVDAVNISQERVDETAKCKHDRAVELAQAYERGWNAALAQPEQEPEWIEDGFGTMWQKCSKKDCGKFVVKIGKVDCWNGDCPERQDNG